MTPDEIDPTGLIRESYRIDGITPGECRSIFVDWAIKLPAGITPQDAIAQLIETHPGTEDHPMTAVLREGLTATPTPRRRGGRSGRVAEG